MVGQVLYEKAIQLADDKKVNYGWLGLLKKIKELSVFMRKMDLWYFTNTFPNYEMINGPIS
ncbi:hypothetical protein [Myroides indicus]|uniref:Uncharacterized protein n=1 Tax=Myroides indicus TaxID=1323422 RepID=A0A4R7EWN8_9FLAO|nr:hypothetical protein [Myroides indicus]TDS59590.1 hypothetical protein C8P70_11038 [Myroides indicus]